ncbi:MAG: helix-turn-helix transcriptional regulator [Polyangiales bacterium]
MRMLGATVRDLRKRSGRSRAQVAQSAGVESISEQVVASIEAQRDVSCDDEFAEALAKGLGCAVDELRATGDEPVTSVTAAPRARDGVDRESESRGPLERALDAAFDANDHIAQDRFSVEAALRYIPVGFIAPREIVGVARAWLDAAAVLRSHGVVPTFTTLAACVSALDGFAAEHAQRLLVRAKEAGALDGEPPGGRS